MKTLLKMGAAALALSLMTSASAFAQADQTNSTPANGAPAEQGGMTGSSAMGAPSGQSTPDQSMSGQSTSAKSMSGQGGMSQGPTGQGQGAMTANAAQTADTPAGSPPSTYPACKHKGEDRCMQEASISGSHHMKRHMMKPKKSTDASDMSGASAPATPPVQ